MPDSPMSQSERPIEGSIWERDDELYMVEKVYEAKRSSRPEEGTMPAFVPITLVKTVRITNMPGHVELATFREKWRPYDPEED